MVAVKALSLRRMTDWKQLELFEREAKTLKALDHRGIPKYIDYLSEDTEKDRGFFLVQACPAYAPSTQHMGLPKPACIGIGCLSKRPLQLEDSRMPRL